jgi:hypothetical protein
MGTVAVVIGIFFVVGLFVGGVAVIALPALRNQGFRRPRQRDNGQPGSAGIRPRETGAARWEDEETDERPRWPGDADGGYSGR